MPRLLKILLAFNGILWHLLVHYVLMHLFYKEFKINSLVILPLLSGGGGIYSALE